MAARYRNPDPVCRNSGAPRAGARSGPVALLVLLARPAPARVVAPELVVLVDAPLRDRRRLHRLGGARIDAVAGAGLRVAAVGVRLVVHDAAGVLERGRAAGRLRRGRDLRDGLVGVLELDLDVVDQAREVGPDARHE